MTGYTQRGQLGLFLPDSFKPTQQWAKPTPEQREKLRKLRDEFAARAQQYAAKALRGGMRY